MSCLLGCRPVLSLALRHGQHLIQYTCGVGSTVITRLGEQQGAARGCNPNKRGRLSHHPLRALVVEARRVMNFWLPSGDAGSATTYCIHRPPCNGYKTVGLLRADSDFSIKRRSSCSKEVYELHHQHKVYPRFAAIHHSRCRMVRTGDQPEFSDCGNRAPNTVQLSFGEFSGRWVSAYKSPGNTLERNEDAHRSFSFTSTGTTPRSLPG